MKDKIKYSLFIIFLLVLLAYINMTRFSNPEITETQLFLKLIGL